MPLPIHLAVDSPIPIYRQITDQLQELILSGILPQGTSLPSIRILAKELGCSVITTRRAYQDLEVAGLIQTRQGLGTFVANVNQEKQDSHRLSTVEKDLRKTIESSFRMGVSESTLTTLFTQVLQQVKTESSKQGGSSDE
ncbi:transcriptional regulator, GntR family [Marininema mesophilum]|uniref:Transcriptional regulator, GntR family n=1 Tax=Marininema mesophilum TaxID=1048340 RepID=A0A1H3AD81_9BACL|nr:GntR family transcriptional regulator [Marininema mesophilum]SDX27431.1 transcriptional regulator, GntR family [Marininema mesophilum]